MWLKNTNTAAVSRIQQSIQNMEQMSAHFKCIMSAITAHQLRLHRGHPRAILIANTGKDSKLLFSRLKSAACGHIDLQNFN